MAMALIGCSDEVSSSFAEEGDDIKAGEPVMFATYMPGVVKTRATAEEAFNARMTTFVPVTADYEFNVEMFEQNVTEALGNADYLPTKAVSGEGDTQTVTYATDGTLVLKTGEGAKVPLYWPGNAKRYGFKATAGTTTLETEQTTEEKLLQQDRLLGYGFEPLWDATNNRAVDNEDALNFRTPKEWKTANQQAWGLTEASEYKKIPLYLKHQRSLITIILKAGEGVNREDLVYEKALDNIETDIFSYGVPPAENKTIHPLPGETTVDYTSSDYGEVATNVATTQYSAVVEPHNYLAGATSDVIAEIRLSGQRFTFYAQHDFLYGSSLDATASNHAEAETHMNGYNLTAGKHLIITATLGRGSRKILITAHVEDWTEAVTTSIVDDYGQAGDPIQINNRKELRMFLESDRNKPGNVAIIVPNSMNLEQEEGVDNAWTPQPLNCTLNMAGATFRTNHPVFSTVGASGNLVNGTISVGDATVTAAVAETNLGTLKRVNVEPEDVSGNNSTGKATRAGLVVTNSGTISECSSTLPVKGDVATGTVYVGGIAARSVYSEANGNTMPVIDGCSVDARVDGGIGNYGGGIVGEAVGRVTNNNFIYGITLSQNLQYDRFENIVQAKADETHTLRAYDNAWPTKAENDNVLGGHGENENKTPVASRYDAVIDCQEELALLLTDTYNKAEYIYRLSNDFTVTKQTVGSGEGWPVVQGNDILNNSGGSNVYFKLDGNNKTITTDAMLFNNIQNDIYDLTIRLGANLIATKSDGTAPDGQDVMAPLAYSVYGATLSNIQVKGGDYRIQAATVGGIVVWAYHGAVIENCQCKASLQVWLEEGVGVDSKIYSGGIVACAANATITRCVFHNTEGSLFRNIAGSKDQTGTFNGVSVAEETPSPGVFYGGILGGTAPKGTGTPENPSVLITDCTSWFSTSGTAQKGAIVGYGEYAEGSNLANGIADGCQGNWWNTTSDGIGTYLDGKTIEQLIGKRNAVMPMQDANY